MPKRRIILSSWSPERWGGPADDTGGIRVVSAPPDFEVMQFKMADTDGNGYLDEKEAARSPVFRNTFRLMDRDGDGKLYEKEVREYLATMEGLEAAVAGTGLTLNVADRGRGLFDVLDTNKDGRLSVREMRQLPRLVD